VVARRQISRTFGKSRRVDPQSTAEQKLSWQKNKNKKTWK
tara:strand:- start:1113 stop:1232 length:120 start_codon:yes stop_codon:yes gene_type:complete